MLMPRRVFLCAKHQFVLYSLWYVLAVRGEDTQGIHMMFEQLGEQEVKVVICHRCASIQRHLTSVLQVLAGGQRVAVRPEIVARWVFNASVVNLLWVNVALLESFVKGLQAQPQGSFLEPESSLARCSIPGRGVL